MLLNIMTRVAQTQTQIKKHEETMGVGYGESSIIINASGVVSTL